MLITLYVLNYNYGHFLPECIDSILNQTDREFNVILVDNGSTDGSDVYLSDLAKNNGWKYLEFENISLGAVGNKIMKCCGSKYIVRLDADDFLASHFIRSMKASVDRGYPDLIFGNFYYVDGGGKTYGKHDCMPRGRFESNIGYHDEPVHGACTLINVKSFLSKGGYDEDLPCQDGFDLYLKMRSSKIDLIEDYCFYYRRGHRSLSSRKQRIFNARNTIIGRRFDAEAITFPKVCNYCICPSNLPSLSSDIKDGIIEWVRELVLTCINAQVVIVIAYGDAEGSWPEIEGVEYQQWNEIEANEISSRGLISRLDSIYKPEISCSINLGEPLVPAEYVSVAPKYTLLMETDGCITGTRFDQSLFRPVVGGVRPVQKENVTRDVDRWVVHTGGVTCLRKGAARDDQHTCSLLEAETYILKRLL